MDGWINDLNVKSKDLKASYVYFNILQIYTSFVKHHSDAIQVMVKVANSTTMSNRKYQLADVGYDEVHN